jgi:hypothetical protein
MTSKGIVFAVLFMGAGALAASQERAAVAPKQKPGDGFAELVKEMKGPLGLTPEQMAKADAILKRRAEQAAAERASRTDSREEKLRKIDALNRKAKEDIDALLTEPQRAKLEEIRRQRRARAHRPPGQEPQSRQ